MADDDLRITEGRNSWGLSCAHCGQRFDTGERVLHVSRPGQAHSGVPLHEECLEAREDEGLDPLTGR